MRTANYQNHRYQTHLSEDSPMYMEPFERRHVEQFYLPAKEQLVCWGEESNFLDSEFCFAFEKEDQGI